MTSQEQQRERADKIATMIAGELRDCPPMRALAGAIHVALNATEPEVAKSKETDDDRNRTDLQTLA